MKILFGLFAFVFVWAMPIPGAMAQGTGPAGAGPVGAGPVGASPVEVVPAASGSGPVSGTDVKGFRVRELHPPATPSPFPLDGEGPRRQSLEFLAPGQMTNGDRLLAEANQDEIARRAGLQGFRLDSKGSDGSGKSSWGYEQAVCPVFPNHLILEYSRDEGRGDLTLFSAVVPRGEGHVRVIPVRRRGYSLFTPVSSNSLTLNDFNHMVQEGNHGLDADSHPNGKDLPLGTPDWLTLGLCYGALAGGHVRAALHPATPADEQYPLLSPATLIVTRKGGAEVRIGDETPAPHGMDWKLRFAQSGRLMKVSHRGAQVIREKPVAGDVRELQGKPVPGDVVDVGGK